MGSDRDRVQPDGPMNMPDGIRMELTTVLQRIQLLGFNAIRLPFSFTDLFTLGPRNYTKNCTHVTDAEVRPPAAPRRKRLLPSPCLAWSAETAACSC